MSNKQELMKRINHSIKKTMIKDVSEYVRKNVNKAIAKDVYGAYTPMVYKRKYLLYKTFNHTVDDMSSSNNNTIVGYGHDAKLRDGRSISKLIILGQEGAKRYGSGIALYNEGFIANRKAEYGMKGYNGETPFYEPRNFINTAKEMIDKKELVKIIEGGIYK